MNAPTQLTSTDLAIKIARLVEERGWNQEDFARIAGLNRQTVRQILQQTNDRRLRNATVSAPCPPIEWPVMPCRSISTENSAARSAGSSSVT